MAPMATARPAGPKRAAAIEAARAEAPMLERAALGMLLGEAAEPGPPEREIGRLRAGEERRDDHQHHEARQLEEGDARHGNARAR